MKKIIVTAIITLTSFAFTQAQVEEKQEELTKVEKLGVKIKTVAKPDVYVDGKKFDFDLQLIDPEMIAAVDVIKDEKALKEYNAPNGVIIITTKFNAAQSETKIKIRGNASNIEDDKPLIIVDGKVKEQAYLKEISPEDIESINVLKGKKAEKYDSPNGVILITTKSAKKKD